MSFCGVCNPEQIPGEVWQDTKATVSWASSPIPTLVETEKPSWGNQATSQRCWTGKSLCSTTVMPHCRHRHALDLLEGKKHPHLPVRGDLNWENLANKPAPAFWRSPAEAEALCRCIWRRPLWPSSGSLNGSPSCWPCVGLPSSLSQTFPCRSACWGRQGESSILASLIFQGSLKPGQNLFATGSWMQHADTVISIGQDNHTAENYFLHVKNIPVGWNKQN